MSEPTELNAAALDWLSEQLAKAKADGKQISFTPQWWVVTDRDGRPLDCGASVDGSYGPDRRSRR